MEKVNMDLGNQDGYADFYEANEVDYIKQEIDKMLIKDVANDSDKHKIKTITNNLIKKIQKLWDEKEKICTTCNGTREIRTGIKVPTQDGYDLEECPDCKGELD